MLIRVITLFLVLGWIAPPSLRAQSPQVLTDALQSLADAVVKEIEQGGKRKIAVVPFHDLALQQETMFGRYVSEELVTRLFQTGNVDIVERQRLDALLEEAKLGTTGVVEPATAREIGKVAGVDALVTGTIADFQSFVAVNARLVDTETGQIFGAAQVKIVRDDDVEKILAMPLPKANQPEDLEAGFEAHRDTSNLEKGAVPLLRAVADEISYELLGCHGKNVQINCEFRVINGTLDQDFRVYLRGSRAFDEKGTEYAVTNVEIANSTNEGGWTEKWLVKGVPTPMSVSIESSGHTQRLSLLELRLTELYEGRTMGGAARLPTPVVQFRDIPIKY